MTTQIEAVVVQPDGEVSTVTLDGSLQAFQQIVGGYIEGVFGPDFTMYVNEEGLIHGLPHNVLASLFVSHFLNYPTHLVGPAIILGAGDSEGNDTSVHQSVLDYYQLEN